MLLWTFHSCAQAALHILCREDKTVSKETFCAFLDSILLLCNLFFVVRLLFFFSPSYINSVSSSFWDRWWAGDTNELPAAQGRQSEMVCVLRVNRLSTLTKDVTRTWWWVWCTTYCSRLSSHQPMSCVSPREQIPKTAYLIVQTLLCLWGHCCEWCNNRDGESIRLWTHGNWMPCFSGISTLRNKNKEHLLFLKMVLWTL